LRRVSYRDEPRKPKVREVRPSENMTARTTGERRRKWVRAASQGRGSQMLCMRAAWARCNWTGM
jgi:hypothetical protein